MVDGATAMHLDKTFGTASESRQPHQDIPALAMQVRTADGDALRAYAKFAAAATVGTAQSPMWLEAWCHATGADVILVTLVRGASPVLSLPLEIVSEGPIRVARYVGGGHANGNFPSTAKDFGASDAGDLQSRLVAALSAARPDIDLLSLEQQMHSIDGQANPLASMPRLESPDIALAASLEGGFEALLARNNGKRKRKKHRYQLRKYEDSGGFRRIEASSPDEVRRLLEAFFVMKAARFRQLGIQDVFAAPSVRAFFKTLFLKALEDRSPRYILEGLEVGGVLRAVTGSSLAGGRLVCDFGAIADDELSQFSPGEFLLFENIKNACAKGFDTYDLGIGDEQYKRQWCNIEIRHFHNLVPLTAKGRVFGQFRATTLRAKRWIKSSPTLRSFIRRLRRQSAGTRT